MNATRFALIAFLLPASLYAQDFRYQTHCKATAKLLSESSSLSASATTSPARAWSSVPLTRNFNVPITNSTQMQLLATLDNATAASLSCSGVLAADTRARANLEIDSFGDGAALRAQAITRMNPEASVLDQCALPTAHLGKGSGVGYAEIPFKTQRTGTLRIDLRGSLRNSGVAPTAADFGWTVKLYRDRGADCGPAGDPLLRDLAGRYWLGVVAAPQIVDIPMLASDNYVLVLEWTALATLDVPRNIARIAQGSYAIGTVRATLSLR